jgi:hypothetical protein
MKLVTFTRDMKPQQAGDQRLVPDDMAARLVAEGSAKDPRDWSPKTAAEPSPVASDGLSASVVNDGLSPKKRAYQTKA